MTTAALAGASKSVAVTLIGLSTLLLGGAYAAFGVWVIIDGALWFKHPGREPVVQVIALGGIVPALIIVFGVAFLLQGILVLVAGLGVLLHKQWGRILTLILAIVAILWGLVWVGGSDQDVADIALGGGSVWHPGLCHPIQEWRGFLPHSGLSGWIL